MRYFAKIEKDNKVSKVVQFADDFANPVDFMVNEAGEPGTWLETWEDGGQRKNFACAGYDYDPELDAFIGPKFADNFIFDTELAQWIPPVPKPEGNYVWDFEDESWRETVAAPIPQAPTGA